MSKLLIFITVILIVGVLGEAQSPKLVGGPGAFQPPNHQIQSLIKGFADQIRTAASAAHQKVKMEGLPIEVMAYREQVVAGSLYEIAIEIGGHYRFMVTIFEQPWTNTMTLKNVKYRGSNKGDSVGILAGEALPPLAGGLGAFQHPDDHIKSLIIRFADQIRTAASAAHQKVKMEGQPIKVLGYRKQVVAGALYHIYIEIGGYHRFTVTIFEQSWTNTVELKDVMYLFSSNGGK